MRLHTRIALLISLLILLLTACGGTLLYFSEYQFLQNKLQFEHTSILNSFAQNARDMLLIKDELGMINYAKLLKNNPAILSAFFIDTDNKVLAHSDPSKINSYYKPGQDNFNSAVTVHRKPIELFGKLKGAALIIYSRQVIENMVKDSLFQITGRILAVCIGILVCGVAGAFIIAKSITGPISRIADGTRKVAENKLDFRLEINRTDEIGRLAGDFNLMTERLGELDKMKSDFVSTVTHELRSPLSAIESYANLMIDDITSGRKEKDIEHIAVIRNNTIRLTRFINDILELAKLESGKAQLRKLSTDLNSITAETIQLFMAKAAQSNISLEPNFAGALPEIYLDPDKIRQVITNLLSNALKFTPSGGRIIISTVLNDKNEYVLSIKDSGVGIEKKDLVRIFNKFEQVKGAKGTGLGLAISKNIVEAHGGRIWAESKPGDGSTFYFTLPA